MKSLKFQPHFIKPILSRKKTSTWRMFDDKNISIGDEVELLNKETSERVAIARITSVKEKPLGELQDADFKGHNFYKDQEDMLEHYKEYYGDRVTLETPLKIIDFNIL